MLKRFPMRTLTLHHDSDHQFYVVFETVIFQTLDDGKLIIMSISLGIDQGRSSYSTGLTNTPACLERKGMIRWLEDSVSRNTR
jgi:hypothetical protein